MTDRLGYNASLTRRPIGTVIDVSDFVERPEQRRQLSIGRVLCALVLLGGIIFGAETVIRRNLAVAAPAPNAAWFAPYVDTTLTPTFNFQNLLSNPARQVVLGFVVASGSDRCAPSWGDYYSLSQAATGLNLDRRIAEYRSLGGSVAISFGGEANEELAVACTSVRDLAAAYESVIKRYGVTTLDFDIEGAALGDAASLRRRAAALAIVERKTNVRVWLTIPASPTGIGPLGENALSSLLRARVPVAGVNVMAFDFGVPEKNMLTAVERSIASSVGQVQAVDYRFGIKLTGTKLWNTLGATVMIGQNDSSGEQFSQAAARSLVAYVQQQRLLRLSMWSINRDASCGSSFAEVGVLSNTCSGVGQTSLQFTRTFDTLAGSMNATSTRQLATLRPITADTNPANAPYPLWQPNEEYETGYKVVREGFVYQSKWYNSGQDPAVSVQYAWQTPWLLMGPVLPTDHAPTATTLPAGAFPVWSPSKVYQQGAEILFNGLPYRAAWYNVGSSPAAALSDASSSPWKAQYQVPGEPKQ